MADLIVVQCACGSVEEAEAIAAILLDANLAACVQIAPVVSLFVWRGQRQRAAEHVMTIKTRAALFGQVSDCIRATHSYETPEIIALPILDADPGFAAWVAASTGG